MTTNGFDLTVSVANIVALLAVSASFSTLLVSTQKDRKLRKTQYADQIRKAAAILTAKLERWRDLAHGIFEEIQPEITDADVALTKEHDVVATRDKFWRDLGVARLSVSQKIRDEQIEIAYADLFGYDPKVRDLFLTAIDRLQAIRETTHQKLSNLTQNDILRFQGKESSSAELGNRLRTTCARVAAHYTVELAKIAEPFRKEMIKLIEASDDEIANKTVILAEANSLFGEPLDNLFASQIMSPQRSSDPARKMVALPCCHDGMERYSRPITDFWTEMDAVDVEFVDTEPRKS